MIATPNESVSRSEPKSMRSSPTGGQPAAVDQLEQRRQDQRGSAEQEHRGLGVGRASG